MREKIINAIIEYSGDELTIKDYQDMARENENQLLDRLIHILSYYFDHYNN